MKKVLVLIFWTLMISGVAMLFIFANKRYDTAVCNELSVDIDAVGGKQLISGSYVRERLEKAGFKIEGEKLSDIRAEEIQAFLRDDAFIKNANLVTGVNGNVKIHVLLRQPLLRVFTGNGQQYYIDTEGYLMPVSNEFAVRVVVASGRISAPASKHPGNNLSPSLKEAYLTAKALDANDFAAALTDQIYINKSGAIELIPKLGNHTILLGDTTSLNEKLENLKLFYKHGIRNDTWDKYKVINLRFHDQIVCSKL